MADKPKSKLKPNICQYWIKDEPVQCANWDEAGQICIFKPSADESGATHAPYCNYIGTATTCTQYNGTDTKARCILPDPSRHVVNRTTGEKWSRDEINGYSSGDKDGYSGDCDGYGTDTTCSGYSPYHMAFGKLKPSLLEEIDEEGFATRDEFGYRLPLNFEIYNKRAQLSRCYWWKAETSDFTIDADTGNINPPEFKCTNPDEITNQFNELKWDNDLGMTRASCNGSKPECPRYTSSICWEYCIDEKTRQGDKVLAEQILELRYYIRKDGWTAYEYEISFKDPNIFAGAEKLWRDLIEQKYDKHLIDVNRTYISDFEVFDVGYEQSFLTAGTPDKTYEKDYPTKVEQLKTIRLTPIIRSKFDNAFRRKHFVFEATKLLHKHILIVGDVFYYKSKVYGINLSDPELGFLPRELLYFNSMAEIEAVYTEAKDPEGYTRFYNDLKCKLENIIIYRTEKIIESGISGTNSFYINVETFFGNNDIVVFDKGSGFWEYDKISVKKMLCNGIIGQTSFFVDNSGNTVDYLPSYEDSFAGFANRTGEITFSFFTFASSEGSAKVDYIYNDGVRKRLNASLLHPAEFGTYEMCYKLFKVEVFGRLELEQKDFRMFGNAGWVLVIIPDEKKLSNVIKPWIVEEKIILTVKDSLDVSHDIEMEIVDREENIDKLEVNQIIIKPKNIKEFRQPCSAKLNIGPIYNYEKRSFNESPSGEHEEVREPFISEDDVIDYRDTLKLENQDSQYKLTQFGTEVLMISAVFKGVSGRPRGQTKTKMITWVRQPYCRDVEINYSWYAEYQKCTLLPETFCWGSHGLRCEIELQRRGMTPPCGDHNLSIMSGKGPMWYPYGECDNVARWNITGPLTEWDINIMDCFWEGVEPPHGYWDMRMLGPDDRDGRTCDSHAHWTDCTCDWSFCNYDKKTSNIFSGRGMYRGGLQGNELFKCIANGGDPPKFGNVFRDFLRTFRSMDNVDYYYFSGRQFLRRRKWLPMPEFYALSDVTADTNDYPFLSYSSNDFYDDGGSFVHPMGLMLANSKIEDVDIGEELNLERYKFEEVFDTHSSTASLYYPYPKSPCLKMVGGELRPIMSWYTYKDYSGKVPEGEDVPEGGDASSYSIQWAWREIWKDINRLGKREIDYYDAGITECCQKSKPLEDTDKYVKHTFFDYYYPPYKYDCTLKEHQLVCDERIEGSFYTVFVSPPSFDLFYNAVSEQYIIYNYFTVSIDENQKRSFDLDGNWDIINQRDTWDAVDYWTYQVCTKDWFIDMSVPNIGNDVTLFTDCYPVLEYYLEKACRPDGDYIACNLHDEKTQKAFREAGRVIESYDDVGELVEEFYSRGLQVALNKDKLAYLPLFTSLLDFDKYDIKFSNSPEIFTESKYIIGSKYDGAVTGEWFSNNEYCYRINYMCDNTEEIEISFKILKDIEGAVALKDSGIGAITRIECTYLFGAEEDSEEYNKKAMKFSGNLFHIPSVSISVWGASEGHLTRYECTGMSLANKEDNGVREELCSYNFELDGKDIYDVKYSEAQMRWEMITHASKLDLTRYVKIQFNVTPTGEEINKKSGLKDYYSNCNNLVSIQCIKLYHTNFASGEEQIETYERKYNISSGKHGDFPPHGYNSTGSLLYPSLTDASTVYQKDSIGGVVGMPDSSGACKTMNKCRGRIMGKCHVDKESFIEADFFQGGESGGGGAGRSFGGDGESFGGGGEADLYEWEAEQKKIHDAVVDSGDVSFQMTAVCPPGIKEYLDKAGVGFQRWSCAFVNMAIMKLSSVIPRAPFNAKGHYFDWDMENMHGQICGGLIFGRFWRDDVFDYVYRSAATGEAMWDSMDVFVAYYRGTGAFLVSPMNYLAADMSRADQFQENLRSLTSQQALFGAQQCQLPPAAPIM